MPTEPAILYTCRQIRAESLDIYYQENDFVFDIEDHDARNYIRWCKSAKRRHDIICTFMLARDATNWFNLMLWAKALYHDECDAPVTSCINTDTPVTNVATYVLSLVEELMERDMTWEVTEGLLQTVRKALGILQHTSADL